MRPFCGEEVELIWCVAQEKALIHLLYVLSETNKCKPVFFVFYL